MMALLRFFSQKRGKAKGRMAMSNRNNTKGTHMYRGMDSPTGMDAVTFSLRGKVPVNPRGSEQAPLLRRRRVLRRLRLDVHAQPTLARPAEMGLEVLPTVLQLRDRSGEPPVHLGVHLLQGIADGGQRLGQPSRVDLGAEAENHLE